MMIYRKADMNDLPAVRELVTAAIASLQAHGNMQWDERYPTDEDYIPDIQSDTQYLGYIGDRLALLFALNTEHDPQYDDGRWSCPDDSYTVLHRFILHPDFQGQGLSRAALTDIIDMLKADGVRSIRLDVYQHNEPAQGLYRSFGFREVGLCTFRDKFFDLMELDLQKVE